MSSVYNNEPMLELFVYETSNQLEQLEKAILDSEKSSAYSSNTINEVFRITHTIKSSAAMMLFDNISTLSHAIEDLFYFLRESKPQHVAYSELSDLVLQGVDFIKVELEKIRSGDEVDGNATSLIKEIKEFLEILKSENSFSEEVETNSVKSTKHQFYIAQDKSQNLIPSNNFKVTIRYQEGCEMENIRAFTLIHNLKEITQDIYHIPEDIINDESSVDIIRRDGFVVYFKSQQSYDEMHEFFMKTIFLKDLELVAENNEGVFNSNSNRNQILLEDSEIKMPQLDTIKENCDKKVQTASAHQSMISVNVNKLDKLMDLVGELVISEAMVTQNPDVKKLELDNFQKAATHLRKITGELQDMVMAIRMVPLAPTFHKMNRIVRDMSKKLNKKVELEIIGEDTEVDKNIIEHIADPLMHLVRNSIDHGIEGTEERKLKGKPEEGTVTLEARNAGSEVLIIVRDDGKGLSKEKILKRARENSLLNKEENEMTDREIFSLIFLPGFSTKESVTEFSGRGVGMDVVVKNIEAVGGSVLIDSVQDKGTIITIKIPLTLAIIGGMNIKVGASRYTIPTTSIRQSFRPRESDIINDPDGNEMIMVRGQCYQIVRLHELYKVKTKVTSIHEGIVIMVENNDKAFCIFADELLGEQQVVVKALPNYIKVMMKKIRGVSGCTLLGDGNISLILDVGSLQSL